MTATRIERTSVGGSVLLPARCLRETRALDPSLRSGFRHFDAPVAALRNALAPKPSARLWYRDQTTLGHWERLETLSQARELIASRDEENPWVTVIREHSGNDDSDGVVNAFEMLGWADRVYVCGDTARSGARWLWSSWPDESQTQRRRVTWVGPPWYRACVFEAQIETVADALEQVAPALRAAPNVIRQANGFAWRARSLDCSANHHLRLP